jgi:anti-anti-sigma regulatory factor
VQISQKKKDNRHIVEVSGALTLAGSLELKKTVLDNLKKGKHLDLAFGEVTDADLSFIQIIAAAVKMAEKGDRKFTLKSPIPELVLSNIKIAGLLNHDKCSKSDCVWCSINEQSRGA